MSSGNVNLHAAWCSPKTDAESRAALTALVVPLLFFACSTEAPNRSSLPEGSVAPASAEPTQPDLRLITPDGWGPLRIGMSRAEVVQAAGEDAHLDAVGGPDPETCDEFRPRNAPDGVLVMIQDGVLTRISVSRNRDIATPAGIRVGDAGSTVLTRYGAQARVEPHKYWAPPARYVTVWRWAPPDTVRRGIRYEINMDDEVVHLRAGGQSIEYVEGCS